MFLRRQGLGIVNQEIWIIQGRIIEVVLPLIRCNSHKEFHEDVFICFWNNHVDRLTDRQTERQT